jgi:hypothetical protein
MSDGLTGELGGADNLSRSNQAIVAASGTPSLDMFPERLLCPGPQHGRWRAGVNTNKLLASATAQPFQSAAFYTHRNGRVGNVVGVEDATWTLIGATIESAGAFAGIVWNENVVFVVTEASGAWVPGVYAVASIPDNDTITLADPQPAELVYEAGPLPADGTVTGYLCIGFYGEVFVPIGAPMGAVGFGNVFGIPGTSQTNSWEWSQSKYWDYPTGWIPPGGLAGGARWSVTLACKLTAANLDSRPYALSGVAGQYGPNGKTTIVVTVDPWSNVFVGRGRSWNENVYQAQQPAIFGWNPQGDPVECSFVDGGAGVLRAVVGPHVGDLASTALPVYFVDAANGTLTDGIESGQSYYVNPFGQVSANFGTWRLYHDATLATTVDASTFTGAAVLGAGATPSQYAVEFEFEIEASTKWFRSVAATAVGDVLEHPEFAQLSVGDEMLCYVADGSGLVAGDPYYVVSKPDDDQIVVSATPGGAAFDITSNATAVALSWLDEAWLDLSEPHHAEIVVTGVADGTNDNNEEGVRFDAVLRIIPISETVGGIAFGAKATAGFREYRCTLSRTAPGRSNDELNTSSLPAVGAPAPVLKHGYYTDGAANVYDAYTTTRFDYGGWWDIIHLNGSLLRFSRATGIGLYDYPLKSIQGSQQAHTLSSNGRAATNTLVFRNADTTPIGEVVMHDEGRQLLCVRNLREGEGEYISRDDELTLKTYRNVLSKAVVNMSWNPTTRTMTTSTANGFNKTNDAANDASGLLAGGKLVITSIAGDGGNSHDPDFTPGVFEVQTKTDGENVVLVSGTGLPPYAISAALTGQTFVGYFVDDSGATWNYDPTPVQTLTTIQGPYFAGGNYVNATGVVTEAGAFADWDWYSGAQVWLTGSVSGGTAIAKPAYYPVSAATDDTITLGSNVGGTAADNTNIAGQMTTNIPITALAVERGPQRIDMAVRVAVTGPPSGDVDLEVNTYFAELIGVGSR